MKKMSYQNVENSLSLSFTFIIQLSSTSSGLKKGGGQRQHLTALLGSEVPSQMKVSRSIPLIRSCVGTHILRTGTNGKAKL